MTEEIMFLNQDGKKIEDVDFIKQNYNDFETVWPFKQNTDNPNIYDLFDEGKDFENDCKIFLAHKLSPKSK